MGCRLCSARPARRARLLTTLGRWTSASSSQGCEQFSVSALLLYGEARMGASGRAEISLIKRLRASCFFSAGRSSGHVRSSSGTQSTQRTNEPTAMRGRGRVIQGSTALVCYVCGAAGSDEAAPGNPNTLADGFTEPHSKRGLTPRGSTAAALVCLPLKAPAPHWIRARLAAPGTSGAIWPGRMLLVRGTIFAASASCSCCCRCLPCLGPRIFWAVQATR